jgi:hypothetical protein
MPSSLVEPDVRWILETKLQECHQTRLLFYTRLLNLILLAVFVVGIGGFIYYKSKQYSQKYVANREKRQQKFLDYIQQYHTSKRATTTATDLPIFTLRPNHIESLLQ